MYVASILDQLSDVTSVVVSALGFAILFLLIKGLEHV
jgi:hypothetical protein